MTVRIQPVDATQVQGPTAEMFQAIKGRMGKVPNMMKTMAQSPAVLGGYLGLSGALEKGVLSPALQQQVALYVSQVNGCEYCLSAHSLLAKHAGLTPDQIKAARLGKADDVKGQGVLNLTANLLERRGSVSEEQLADARNSGVSDAEVLEVIGHTALTVFTNFVNQTSGAEVDFPKVPVTV